MNRRKFLNYVGCSCGSLILSSCTTVPITERKQLKLIPEYKLNAQAAQIYEKIKSKEKLSKDKKKLFLDNLNNVSHKEFLDFEKKCVAVHNRNKHKISGVINL